MKIDDKEEEISIFCRKKALEIEYMIESVPNLSKKLKNLKESKRMKSDPLKPRIMHVKISPLYLYPGIHSRAFCEVAFSDENPCKANGYGTLKIGYLVRNLTQKKLCSQTNKYGISQCCNFEKLGYKIW
ncbi:MAG: hypothetical protein ACRCR2_01970 [Fusobacteriaceae bacterium]